MSRCLRLAACVALGLSVCTAHAAVSCSISLTSISVNYDPALTTDTATTGSYTISCTRLASDPNTFNWQLGVNDGQQPSGLTNRAAYNGAYYLYELYKIPPYTNANRWRDANSSTRIAGTLNFGGQLTASQTGAFDLRLAALQTVQPAGTYTDIVTATLRTGAGVMMTQTTFNVAVITIPTCTLASPPGTVSFNYTSFQAGAAAASTSFGVSCTTALAYTMALDATSGTLLGLPYSLSLSQSAGTGTGTTQTYSINGSIAGGLSGTCATAVCSASDVRTLTITY
jgi:spore coat protein U-like protein